MTSPADIAEQFEALLGSAKQSWLLGAGISFPANVPLMYPLTDRVYHRALTEKFSEDDVAKAVINFIKSQIAETDHIEVFLTQLGDFISLSERNRDSSASIGEARIHKSKLTEIHIEILGIIAETVRWGFKPAYYDADGTTVIDPQLSGTVGQSIVSVDYHQNFIAALFGSRRAGLENLRGRLEFFTTNYDTLIEDALALNGVEYCDGFSGGGVGFWNPASFVSKTNAKAFVTKLHGSIDWYRSKTAPSPLLRTRSGDCYPPAGGSVMIYPQATKYQNAQMNPFHDLFQRFRSRLGDGKDHTLLTCGYSFGDDHINADIEIAMSSAQSQLVILAFAHENADGLPAQLRSWRTHAPWKSRLYIASPKGLYRGDGDPVFGLADASRSWWTFEGVTKLLKEGLPADIQAAMQ